MSRKLTGAEERGARKAVDTWTKKFADAERRAGKSADVDACRRRATEHVKRAVKKKESQG